MIRKVYLDFRTRGAVVDAFHVFCEAYGLTSDAVYAMKKLGVLEPVGKRLGFGDQTAFSGIKRGW